MSRGDIETLRGSIASATGQASGAAGTASDEAEQHINSANTRLTGQRTAQNEDEETASQTSATSAASRTRAQTGNSSSRRLQDPRRNPFGQSSSFAPFHQNQAAASTFPRRDPFHGRPSAGRGDFSVRGGFGGGMRDNRAGLGSFYDGQDAYFDDQASVGSANGRQARLFSSRMLTANVAQPIGPPSGAGLYPRLDTNWLVSPIQRLTQEPKTYQPMTMFRSPTSRTFVDTVKRQLTPSKTSSTAAIQTMTLQNSWNKPSPTSPQLTKPPKTASTTNLPSGNTAIKNLKTSLLSFTATTSPKASGINPAAITPLHKTWKSTWKRSSSRLTRQLLTSPTFKMPRASRRAERPTIARKRQGPGRSPIQKEIGLQDAQAEPRLPTCQQRVQLLSEVQPAHPRLYDESTPLNICLHTSADFTIGSDTKIYNSDITRTWPRNRPSSADLAPWKGCSRSPPMLTGTILQLHTKS